jgi:ABC-type multidrug transport system fused ATPase/permease subunit
MCIDVPKPEAPDEQALKPLPRDATPATKASCLSAVTFGFMDTLMATGYLRGKLDLSDLWPYHTSSGDLCARFDELWEEELRKPKEKRSLPGLVWTLIGRRFALCGAVFGFSQLLQFVGPACLFAIVTLLYEQQDCDGVDDDPACASGRTTGFILAAVMFFSFCLQGVCIHWSQHISMDIGLQVRSSLIVSIMRKTMRLSAAGLTQTSTGAISNMMNNDSQQIVMFVPLLHMGWTAPLVIVFCFTILGNVVGVAALGGIGVVALLIPFIGVILTIVTKFRTEQLKFTDKRISFIQDAVQGIRVIKAYGWERSFKQLVEDQRLKEYNSLAKMIFVRCFFAVVILAAPILVAVAVFSLFLNFAESINPAGIFTAFAVLSLLRFPLAFAPFILIQWTNVRVSLKRIQGFLEADERPTREALDTPPGAVNVESLSVGWPLPEAAPPAKGKGKGKGKGEEGAKAPAAGKGKGKGKGKPVGPTAEEVEKLERELREKGLDIVPIDIGGNERKVVQVLKNLQLTVPQGKLTFITGPIGCGKSTVLAGLLDEAIRLGGTAATGGRVAYAPQTHWIINA